jgi:hypothetical protein
LGDYYAVCITDGGLPRALDGAGQLTSRKRVR